MEKCEGKRGRWGEGEGGEGEREREERGRGRGGGGERVECVPGETK